MDIESKAQSPPLSLSDDKELGCEREPSLEVGDELAPIQSSTPPPPDGGLQAWTVCACTHLVIMMTWGLINSFGVFQTYYTTLLDRPPSDVAWIGGLQVFTLFFVGTFTGRLSDAGHFRPVFIAGTIMQVVGGFMTSISTQYWHLILSQGILTGIGNGFLFCPTLSTLSTYFHKRKSLALGLGASGSATGGLVFPAMVQQLLPRIGFPWTMRAITFIQLAALLVANVFLRRRIPPRKNGSIVEWGAFKEMEYTLFAAGMFFNLWGAYLSFYYLASFSRDIIGLSYTSSLNLVLILNGVGIVARLVPSYFADHFGPLNIMVPVCLVVGVINFSWIAVGNVTGTYVWAVFNGIMAASLQGLFPGCLTSLTGDLKKAGVRMGMVFTIVSFAVLTGPPIAGAIITAMDGHYLGAQLFAGISSLLGTCLLAGARTAKARRSGQGLKANI